MYKPQPIDTTDVNLDKDLLELTEMIAKNTHDVWAIGRINEGWTYAGERNNEEKTTPCLVEYEQLPESEKQYDRNTSFEAIKLIIKLGYKIVKE